MAHNKFTKGSATFICDCCGHNTRNTGVQSIGSKICPACYELAGLENMLSDEGKEGFVAQHGAEEVVSWMASIYHRDATRAEYEKAKKSFDSLADYFPTEEQLVTNTARETKSIAPASDHSVKGAVAVCKEEFPLSKDRKEFITRVMARGVIKATAGTQWARIRKEA